MNEQLVKLIAQCSQDIGGALAPEGLVEMGAKRSYTHLTANQVLEVAGQAMAQHGIVICPRLISHDEKMVTYEGRYGPQTRYDITVIMQMDVHGGGEMITTDWLGIGVDSNVPDKALYKAITSGHKYFLMKLFNIGAGNPDGEHEQHEQYEQKAVKQEAVKQEAKPIDMNKTLGESKKARNRFHAVGAEKYGEEWGEKREKIRSFYNVKSSNDLTIAQAKEIVTAMQGESTPAWEAFE